MDETTMVYLAASIMVALLALLQAGSFGAFMIPIVVISVLAILLILLINYADFLLFPLITIILNMKIVPAKNYYIPKHQNCVIKNVNGLYYATGYLTANLYNYIFTMEQAEENEDMKLSEAPSKWERLMMSIKFPFKYNLIVFSQDIQEYRETLEGKLGLLEFKLSKEMSSQNPSQMGIDDLQRQIRVTQAKIDRLSMGEKPVQSLMYIETVAVGVSEKAAIDSLSNQLNQLQVVFNALDINIMRVVGREVYLLFKFNYFVPTTTNELMSLFASQK
ncbi:MAG: hypothetical protein ACP5RF_01915 [Candidatus Micrarchaeia archaeon]